MIKKLMLLTVSSVLIFSCGGKKEEKKNGFEVSRTKKEDKKEVASHEVLIDLDNVGVGPITEMRFPSAINQKMVSKGKATFNAICIACHMPEKRMIGPAMKGIYERRNPAWVMKMILNPDGMLKEDPIAKALLKEYNNAVMLNQNLSEEEARNIAEYLRTL